MRVRLSACLLVLAGLPGCDGTIVEDCDLGRTCAGSGGPSTTSAGAGDATVTSGSGAVGASSTAATSGGSGGGGGGGGGAATVTSGSGAVGTSSTAATSGGSGGGGGGGGGGGAGGAADTRFSFGDPADGGDASVWDLAFDTHGNLVVGGAFSGTVDFGTGPVTALGESDGFLLKYSSTGALLWVKAFGATLAYDQVHALGIDAVDGIVVGGAFTRTLDFDHGYTVEKPEQGDSGNFNAFFARFSPDGDCEWAYGFGDANGAFVSSVAVDGSGNTYAVGEFTSGIQLGAFGFVESHPEKNLFVVSLDSSGTPRWALNPGDTNGAQVAVGPGGEVVIAAGGYDTFDFGGTPRTTPADEGVFLAKLEGLSGHEVWSATYGETGWQSPASIAVDSMGRIALTGVYTADATLDFGGGALPSGQDGAFVAELDDSGGYLWDRSFVPLSAPQEGAGVSLGGIAVDAADHVFVGGSFYGRSVDFGTGPIFGQGRSWFSFVARYQSDGTPVDAHRDGDVADGLLVSALAVDARGAAAIGGRYVGAPVLEGTPLPDAPSGGLFVAKFAP